MLYSIVCVDKPNSVDLRMELRPAHVEHLKAHASKLLIAGPHLDDGGSPVGSLLVFEADTKEAVDAFAEGDPYATGGLFQSVTITPWKRVMVHPDVGAEG